MTIVQEFYDYMKSFLEKAHKTFSGLPVCPFAAKARMDGKIDPHIMPFSISDAEEGSELMSKVRAFMAQDRFHVLLFIHPDKEALSPQDIDAIGTKVSGLIAPGYVAFGGHPKDEFHIAGAQTRRDPYPNFQVISLNRLKEAQSLLRKTKYYANFTRDDLKIIPGHEEYLG